MDLDLSLAQLVIQEKARVFATEHIAPVATRNDREEIFSTGSHATHQELSASREGDDWVLNGRKAWVSSGWVADPCLLFAQTKSPKDYKGITAFLVPTNPPGFLAEKVEGKIGLRAAHTAHLTLSDVHLSDEQRLGEVGEGFRIAMSAVDNGRYGLAAGCVGQAQACLDACITYSKERESFGKPIASHQLVQEMLVEMALQVETARLLVYQTRYLKNKGVKNICQTSLAKLHASEVAVNVARTADELPRSKLRGMYPNRFKVEEGRVVSVVDCRQAEELRDIVPNIENAANIAEIGVGLNPMCRRNGDFEGEKKRRGNVQLTSH